MDEMCGKCGYFRGQRPWYKNTMKTLLSIFMTSEEMKVRR